MELESSITSTEPVYVALQRENAMHLSANFFRSCTDTSLSNLQFVKNDIFNSKEARNAVGVKVTYEITVENDDGTLVDGVILYGAKGLNQPSYESVWGRAPTDTYSGNGGTDPAILSDPVKNTWTDTHEFYEFAEGIKIESGAKSYLLVPEYKYSTGTAPTMGIDVILKGQANRATDPLNVKPYGTPSQVLGSGTNALANGVRVVSTSSRKLRDNYGAFNDGAGGNGTEHSPGTYNPTNYRWSTNVGQDKSYDTGFAVLLDASGSTMQWTGSYNVNGNINTMLFDSSFAQYITQSHGTGGGIYIEDYDIEDNCERIFQEGLVTVSTSATVNSIVVPEDGYRVSRITIDDLKVNIIFDDDGKPIRVEYDGPGGAAAQSISIGQTVTANVTTYPTSGGSANFNLAITYNSDGIVDVNLSNRSYANGANSTNIHADFDTDYYFQKVWEGVKQVPDSVSFTAVPYSVAYDSVKIGNQTYKIETEARTTTEGTKYVTVFTNTADPTDKTDLDPANGIVLDGEHYDTITLAGTRYAILGNQMQAIRIDNKKWVTTGWPYEITTILGRHNGGGITEQRFTVTRDQVTVDTSQPGKTIWKIKYPAAGKAANDSNPAWPALPIEADGIYDAGGAASASHDTTSTHVGRLYWFANEDLSNLHEDWVLKSYDNIDGGRVEVPGLISDQKYKDTQWYVLSTQDHDKINGVMKYMSDIQLAAMTPVFYGTKDYQGNTPYAGGSGQGGIVTNQSIETKLKVAKEWRGDKNLTDDQRKAYRQKLQLNIHREYTYSQPRFNDIPAGETRVTFLDGPTLNAAMIRIAGGAENIDAFRRGVEPSTEQRLAAKRITNAADTALLNAGDVVIIDDNVTQTDIYMWFQDDGATGVIFYWTDADHVFLNQNSSQFFKDLKNLQEITGLFGVNATKARDMSEMFYVTSGDGSLKNLDYLRSFDTALVENLNRFVAGQSSLTDISGIIDWNVGRVPEDGTRGFENMFSGVTAFLYDDNGTPSDPNDDKETFPFAYFPNARIDDDGTLVDSQGIPYVTQGQRADADDMVYSVTKDFDTNTGNDNENNGVLTIPATVPAAATKVGDPSVTFSSVQEQDARSEKWLDGDGKIYRYAAGMWCTEIRFDENYLLEDTWTWVIDDLLLHSDANKWHYETFENDIERYSISTTQVDSSGKRLATESNYAELVLNGTNGYYEYKIINEYMPTLTVSKEVKGSIGSRDKYFKFEVEVANVAPGTILDLTGVKKYEESGTNDATAYVATDIKTAHEIDEDIDKKYKFSEVSPDVQSDYTWTVETTGEVYKYAPPAWYKLSGGSWTKETPPANAVVKYSDVDSETAKNYSWKATDGTVYTYVGPGWYPSEPDGDAIILLDPSKTVTYELLDHDSAQQYIWEKDGRTYLHRGGRWVYLNDPVPGDAVRTDDDTIDYATYTAGNTDEQDYKWKKDGVVYEYDLTLNSWVTAEEPPKDATFGQTNTARIEYMEMNPERSQDYYWQKGGVTYFYRENKWWIKNGSGFEVEQTEIPGDAIIAVSAGLTAEDMTFDTISDANARMLKWTNGTDTYEYLPGHWYIVDENDTVTKGDTTPNTSKIVPNNAETDHTGRTGQQIVCTKDGTPTGSTISDGTVNDKSGSAKFSVYLQHGQKFNIEQLPSGATYTVKEFYEDYKPSVKITGDTKTNDGDDDDSNDKTIKLNQDKTAKTASMNDTAIIDNTTIDYTNKLDATIPTEVRLGLTAGLFGPIMMAILGLRFYLRRRRRRLVRYADGSVEEFYDDYDDGFHYVDFTSDSGFDIVE